MSENRCVKGTTGSFSNDKADNPFISKHFRSLSKITRLWSLEFQIYFSINNSLKNSTDWEKIKTRDIIRLNNNLTTDF